MLQRSLVICFVNQEPHMITRKALFLRSRYQFVVLIPYPIFPDSFVQSLYTKVFHKWTMANSQIASLWNC